MNDGSHLHDQFRRAAAAITVADGSPDDVRARLRVTQRRRVVLRWSAAVAVVAIAAGAVAVLATHQDDSPSINPQRTIEVEYERSVFHQQATLECRHGEIDTTGKVNDVTIETWATLDHQHWRTLYTYSDGSTLDVVAEGGYYDSQSALWYRGEPKIAKVGCLTVQPAGEDGLNSMMAIGGQVAVYRLNQPVENPERTSTNTVGSDGLPPPIAIGTSGGHYYAMYDQANRLPGTFVDSQGRTATKRQIVWGEPGQDGKATPDVWDYFFDPVSGKVLEFVQHNFLDQVGSYVGTMTVMDSGHVIVDAGMFDTSGFTEGSTPYP